MSPILQVDPLQADEEAELAFELDYLASLTVPERFALMFRRSREIQEMLLRYGRRHPAGEIWVHPMEEQTGEATSWLASLDDLIRMKEAAGRPKDREDLRVLRRLRARHTP